ncbi:MAG: Gx transporter family protein, partial [Firmicutes bacterium]|nr:Gx transporter family protein [Bacillota bacterium]
LVAMAAFGRKEALAIFLARAVLGAVFTGGFGSALLFSLAGGFCAWAIMAALYGVFGKKLIWVTSIFGALGHNAGQLIAAMLILRTPAILYYGFALAAAGIVTGTFTGLAAKAVVSRWEGPPQEKIGK